MVIKWLKGLLVIIGLGITAYLIGLVMLVVMERVYGFVY